MLFLAGEPDITPITNLITTWIHIGQALVGSVGALAFIFALACTPITLRSRFSSVGLVHEHGAVTRQVLHTFH